VFLIIHALGPPDADEWQAMLLAYQGLTGPLQGCLVISPDAQLTAVQRTQVGDAVKASRVPKVAVVTASQVARVMVTGLGWLTGVHKGFAPSQRREAMTFLGRGEADSEALRQRMLVASRGLRNRHGITFCEG
jgi:hypothetical protein